MGGKGRSTKGADLELRYGHVPPRRDLLDLEGVSGGHWKWNIWEGCVVFHVYGGHAVTDDPLNLMRKGLGFGDLRDPSKTVSCFLCHPFLILHGRDPIFALVHDWLMSFTQHHVFAFAFASNSGLAAGISP